jgi:LEA14-like dessication related protein
MLLLVIAALALGGCAGSPLFQNPTVSFDGLKVTGAGSEGLDLVVDLQVQNPNIFPVTVRGYRYALTVTGLPFGSGREQNEVTLVPQSATRVQIPARIPFAAILQLLENRLDPDRIPYGLDAVLELSTPFGAQRLPVNHSGLFSVPQKYRPDQYLQQLRRLIPEIQSHLIRGN